MRATLIVLIVLAVTISYAGENAERPSPPECIGARLRERPGMDPDKWQGRGREFMRGLGAGGFGVKGQFLWNSLERLTKDPELAKRVGITEEQIEKIKQAIEPFEAKRKELVEQRDEAVTEQAKLLMKDSIDEEALMTIVEKLGQINTELAKLSVKQLIAVRGLFTQDQIAEIKKNIRTEVEKRIKDRVEEWRSDRGNEKEKPRKEGKKRGEENLQRHREDDGGAPRHGDI